jgi:type II secretory pathway component GspD/PulD (secretin)
MRLKLLLGLLFLGIWVLFPFDRLTGQAGQAIAADEDERDSAVEKAAEEAAVRMNQLAFEKQELVSWHLRKGEELLLNAAKLEELEEAEKEFLEVLRILPGERKASAYLKYIQKLKDSLKKKGNREKAREKQRQLLEGEREKQEALAKIRSEKKKDERATVVQRRRRIVTTEQRIDEHLRQGRKYYGEEKYEEAIGEWEQILELTDPSDRDYQRVFGWMHAAKIAQQRNKELQARPIRKQLKKEMSLHVEEAWSSKKPTGERKSKPEEKVTKEISAARLRLEKKASQLISLDFQNAHLRKVLTYLSKVSGINIVLDENVFPPETQYEKAPAAPAAPPAGGEAAPAAAPAAGAAASAEEATSGGRARVTIRLKDIPLIEALAVILRTKGLSYKLEENIIWITTEENLEAGELVTKTYRPAGGIGDIVDMLRKTVPFDTEKVEGAEVEGPKNSYVTSDLTTGIIFITNTAMNQHLAEDIIRNLSTAPPQASIEARFIDISTSTLAQFGIQWQFPEAFEGMSKDSYIGTQTFSGGKPTAGPGIDTGVSETGQPRGIFIKYSKLTPTQFEAVLQAFELTGDANELSAPKITVMNNYEASIDISTSFPYIESYDVDTETIEINDDDFKISTAVPGDTRTRKIGVMLTVTPGIGADRKTINLTLIPEITELAGWIEYGSSTAAGFTIRQPIFDVRYVTTNVDVNDGDTLVLCGLVRGDERNKKVYVPFFGRIPIVGNFFWRKHISSDKRELLIFITATVIEPTGQRLVGR